MSHPDMIPNSTQIPNVILDLLIPVLGDAESRVLLYLCRRTYGFHQPTDHIALSQFTDGIVKDGRRKDFGTGLGRQAVVDALTFLVAIGLVEKVESAPGRGRGNINAYGLNLKAEIVSQADLLQDTENARKKIVSQLDLFRKGLLGRPISPKKGLPRRPEKVSPGDPQKKEKLSTTQKLRSLEEDPPDGGSSSAGRARAKTPKKSELTLCPLDYQPPPQTRTNLEAKYDTLDVDALIEAMVQWSHAKGERRLDWTMELWTFARKAEARGECRRHPSRTDDGVAPNGGRWYSEVTARNLKTRELLLEKWGETDGDL